MLIRLVFFLFFSFSIFSSSAVPNQPGFFQLLENYFADYIVAPVSKILFFDIAFFTDFITLPFILVWLVSGAVYLTFKMGFIHVRAFRHAIQVTRGKYDDPRDPGEISHFQALSSALSATIGLGNIAGVAVAVSVGGPGAIFWMIIAGFFGMTSKFVECTLALMYRHVEPSGKVLGGPMRYLSHGLAEKGYPTLGRILGALFGILCVGGSFGGGNMFQANQAYSAMAGVFPALKDHAWVFGLILSFLVGLVIIGGIKRIGGAAGLIVPFMCLLYLVSGLYILAVHYYAIPQAFWAIISGAFTPEAGYGGFIGVLITGFRRAAFSNEAGVGSAAIAHSAAATKEPVREGIVASLGPFIDTIVVCTMTGLIVVVTGVYENSKGDGILLTSQAFGTTLSWMPNILAFAVLLFAFSTMISWSYYGERCWAYLFQTNNTLVYKFIFVIFVFLGSIFSLGPVLDFSDLMILGMAFPNILGAVWLAPKVKKALGEYWHRYKSGAMVAYDKNQEQEFAPNSSLSKSKA